MWAETTTQIGKVRVRGDHATTPALRLAAEALLETTNFRPPQMPPAGVLIVRRLVLSAPSRLSPAARFDPTWARLVEQTMASLYKHAIRPNNGRIAGGGDAVLFQDESEMLACLALDVSRGDHATKWWWNALLHGSGETSLRLARLLAERAQFLPAMLSRLVSWQQEATVVTAMAEAEIHGLIQALIGAHQLNPVLSSAWPRITSAGAKADQGPSSVPRHPIDSAAVEHWPLPASPAGTMPAPPWRSWLPASAARGLTPEREYLVGLAVAVHNAPSRARSPLFAAQVLDWRATAGSRGWEDTAEQQTRPSRPSAAATSDAVRRLVDQGSEILSPMCHEVWSPLAPSSSIGSAPQQRSALRRLEIPPESTANGADFRDGVVKVPWPAAVGDAAPVGDKETPDAVPVGDKETPDAAPASDKETPDAAPANDKETPDAAPASDKEMPNAASRLREALAVGVPTRLGGALYLVNLMASLDLPGCFEQDWDLASQIGGWGLLDALARALLADCFETFTDDGLWPVLAALDGRAVHQPPRAERLPADAFRLPVPWYEAIRPVDERFVWAEGNGRLRLWSTLGVLLADLRRDDRPAEHQASVELTSWAGGETIQLSAGRFETAPIDSNGSLNAEISPGLTDWLGFVFPYLHHRLRRALSADGAAVDLVAGLLLVPGHLYVTETHVDLVAGLDAISVPVRLAGLDRNPGWVADLGRVVLFHFQ